jgi:hypothetical protein
MKTPLRTEAIVSQGHDYEQRSSRGWQIPPADAPGTYPNWEQPHSVTPPISPMCYVAPAARESEASRVTIRDLLRTGVRVFGVIAMILAVLVVVADSLYNENRGSVFAAATVGAIFTLGGVLALPRK